ncbi:MAG: Uma2 family endonuclease [Candidatus Eremiobacteraeota bacterium]|nr:Uma2 family endonuclease [Candidatus Eremiobacteraeota bacterium]
MALAPKFPNIIESDEDLVLISLANPGYRFQRQENGTIIVSPTSTGGGAKSGEAYGQLRDFSKRHGGKAFDSNAGFAIGPHMRVFAPDGSWVSQARIDALTGTERSGFWPIGPDVVIEVKSKTDNFSQTVAKCSLFIERGSSYAVAIDPATREVVQLGVAPAELTLDFDAIIDA